MMTFIKILLTLAVLIAMAYPLFPAWGRLAPLFPASALRYDPPKNRRNLPFAFLALIEFLVASFIFYLLDSVAAWVRSIQWIQNLFVAIDSQLSSQVDFVLFALRLVLTNLILLYAFILLKRILRSFIMDPIARLIEKGKKKKAEKQKKEDQTDDGQDQTPSDDQKTFWQKKKKRRVPKFLHSLVGDGTQKDEEKEETEPPRYGRAMAWLLGFFFEQEHDFQVARPWVIRARTILQYFIYMVEALYAVFLLTVLLSVFFPLPMVVYTFLVDVCNIGVWYIYPVLSILFLQEVCNIFRTPAASLEMEEKKKQKKQQEDKKKLEARLRELLNLLKKNFDAEHSLRYYPEAVQEEVQEYEPKNVRYRSALEFIRQRMKKHSGRVVHSYMQCLDAAFSDHHVYFASSFYSELGSYLAAYTYIRLMAGSRMIFVVYDPTETATLRTFLSERLMEMTGTSRLNSWRIHTPGERLDQADILIASPHDFRDGSMMTQYPDFFDEACTAVFLDADRMILSDSYLCPLMAMRLKKATENRIRFLFLTQDLYKGFAARSLPKFFGADPVLAFSSAKENESVSYVLWNRESKSHRIYNERGQKTTSLEYMIADQACSHDIDGVRLMTESPIDHAERKLLVNRGVEINKFFRDVVDVNYMIYSDERCNLAASIYACTRFRGQKKSVVHILSKPYLLREYFISRAAKENFVNRSSFIQPRVPEHVDEHKLSLLRLFCDLVTEDGMEVTAFEGRLREIITVAQECRLMIHSAFCKKLLAAKSTDQMTTAELAAYLIAGLCDTDVGDAADSAAAADSSIGHRAKEFYLIFDPAAQQDRTTYHRKKYIVFNREREVFDRLFACNEKVTLCLNDEIIGTLDTFPLRSHLEYVAGQSILYQNSEYEIEHVSEDGRTLYLRSENVKISHCLDTVHLRRYHVTALEPIPSRTGVLHNTKLNLEEIRVTECTAAFTGETYGFYGLSSDKQTLDFYDKEGVNGNPHLKQANIRRITDGRILKVELQSRIPCTDSMRQLLAAVCNEFIRTLFPRTYREIAIVPMLQEPVPFDGETEPKTETERIRALYPYLVKPSEALTETDDHRITLLFINDCFEDVGAFQWFYDLSGRYMQEFLANVYSYLYWLRTTPGKEHYIFFGGETLCDCFDLDGCCKLLNGFNLVLAEPGSDDISTAGDITEDAPDRCSFCHRPMETGRFSLFDQHRYICADCFEVVEDPKRLQELHEEMRAYMAEKYPEVHMGRSVADLDPVYSLQENQVLSEYYYRVDLTERTIWVERDDPVTNARVSLLRGLIELWQSDNNLINAYSKAQLYYEELRYLCAVHYADSAAWIYEALDERLRAQVDKIAAYTGIPALAKADAAPVPAPQDSEPEGQDAADDGAPQNTDGSADAAEENGAAPNEAPNEAPDETAEEAVGTIRTSFAFMKEALSGKGDADEDDSQGQDASDEDDFRGLYNPHKVPRFLKRYLRNQTADDMKEEDVSDAEEDKNDAQTDEPVETTEDSKKKKKGWRGLFRSAGEKMQPVEDDEATNPKIRLYNEIVRHAYNYDTSPINRSGLTFKQVAEVYYTVLGDYPELFWLEYGFSYSSTTMTPGFRCVDANGELDVKQINQKRKELRKAAKKFTKGITRRTDPYEAVLTIYRRLILWTDYDGVGLRQGAGRDVTKDDTLRSLYSALVDHKVVCAGYAVAMQYLMQSVGVVCACMISEREANGSECHAFNILKLGKYCYYLDATWGDNSNTRTGDKDRDLVLYDYCCTPMKDFAQASPELVLMHKPRKAYYPRLEEFQYCNHEYFRYHKAYLASYNEQEIVRIITETAKAYNQKEMGEFTIGIRTPNKDEARIIIDKLLSNRNLSRLVERARTSLDKRDQNTMLKGQVYIQPTHTGVFYIRFE